MKRGKQAQFYIIAAVIIVLIVIGLAGVSNYITVREEPKNFYDIGEDLRLEGAWVVDYGIYNEKDLNKTILEFVGNFSEYLADTGGDFELYILYGDKDEICTQKYSKNTTGIIRTGTGGFEAEGLTIEIPECKPGYEAVTLPVSGVDYNVEIKENENFLFVISTTEGFERYVYGNI